MIQQSTFSKQLLSVLSWLCILLFCSLQCIAVEITVTAESPTKVHSSSPVFPITIVMCNIQPPNAPIKSRWITPKGEIISQSSGRYTLTEGLTPLGLGTALAIRGLSYEDAGVYTCEVVPRSASCSVNDFPVSSSVQLILQVSLQTPESNVVVSEGATAALRCEMKGYVPPDEDLQWYKGDDIIYNGLDQRFSISFEDGSPNAAQNGGNRVVASRVSLLNISSTILPDAEEYSCRVRGTDVSAAVALSVEKDDPKTTHTPGDGTVSTTTILQETMTVASSTVQPSPSESLQTDTDPSTEPSSDATTAPPQIVNKCDAEQSRMVAMTFGITFTVTVLVSVTLTTAVICLWLKLWQRKNNKVGAPPPVTHKEIGNCNKEKTFGNTQDGNLDIKYSL